MVADLREICARYSTDELQVTVFQPFFIYIDQYLAILPQTLQTIFVTAAVMVLISMLLIPNLACALWVSFSIVSIEIGVVGYMTWWGVRLDGVALINLIMCIGFSVDFSAHICYHYLTAVSEDGIVENNISLTGKYFHDNNFAKLRKVVFELLRNYEKCLETEQKLSRNEQK